MCFPISPYQSPWRRHEVQPVSVAESKIHHMSWRVLRVLLPASSVPVLGPQVSVPPPAQPSRRSTGGEEGCIRSHASRKRFYQRGRGFEAIWENLLMLPQLAWGDCGFASAFLSGEYFERCSDTLSQPQAVVLWLRLQFPQMCTAGWGALVVRLGSELGRGQPPLSGLRQPRGIKAAGLKGSGLLAGLKVGLSSQASRFLFSWSLGFGFTSCTVGWVLLVAVGMQVSWDLHPVLVMP